MTLPRRRALLTALASLALVGLFVLLLPGGASTSARAPAGPPGVGEPGKTGPQLARPLPGPTGTVTESILYLPVIPVKLPPDIELLDTRLADSEGIVQQAFLPGEELSYRTIVLVSPSGPVTSTLSISSAGPCDSGQVFSGTLVLNQGVWEHGYPSLAAGCTGLFTTTTVLSEKRFTPTRQTQHVVNPLSQVAIAQAAGFDKCAVSTVENMQAWWDESPYSVTNIYLGGAVFACPSQALDAVWVHEVAQQGWTFIPTWVGPQPPCTGYNHVMSSNPATAYLEGKVEAGLAAVAARRQGFFGEAVIYYDIEAYPNASIACREAVDAFVTGWTEQLHDLGLKSGVYGQHCSSYMTDWADNSPPPDDIWWARWPFPPWFYDPDASAYGSACIPDTLWANHQRIRQYTGGHSESWGGVPLTIDSNVLDGEVALLPVSSPLSGGQPAPVTITRQGPEILSAGLAGPGRGWALAGGRLLVTDDGGGRWSDVTPAGLIPVAAAFLDTQAGWAAGFGAEPAGGSGVSPPAVRIARTLDGGATWDATRLDLDPQEAALVASVSLEALDERILWASLRLQSGSSFSRGVIYFSGDGGASWERRQAPLGEPVAFFDTARGWTAGGPAGDLLYHTRDGGRTWQPQELPIPEGVASAVGLPHAGPDGDSLLPVILQDPAGGRLVYFASEDGGSTWRMSHEAGPEDALLIPEAANLLIETGGYSRQGSPFQLPDGAVSLAIYGEKFLWSVVLEGSCTGDKVKSSGTAAGSAAPFECTQGWSLLASDDGGSTWRRLELQGM